MSSDRAPVEPGDLLAGRYRVSKILASGAMGVVVAAVHEKLGQKVAVKFLLEAIPATDEAAHRFEREAKAAARLKSEHVARVMDVGHLDNGAPYLVMELLEGEDLDRLVRTQGSLPVEEAVDYVLQALEALGEAHLAGIVHRDLKPGNLFRTQRPDGSPVVKILDFGISKVEDIGPQHMTNTSAVLGSPLYMSPEQMESAKDVEPRSDIWSIGVVLHQLLTGGFPFRADSVTGLAVAIATKSPVGIRSVKPDLPVELEQVVFRCLGKTPGDRYANVAELAAALAPFAPDDAAPHAERLQRLFKRTKVPAAEASSPRIIEPESLGQTEKGVTSGVSKKKSSSSLVAALIGAAAIAGVVAISFRPEKKPQAAAPSSSVPPPVQPSVMVVLEPEPAPTPNASVTTAPKQPIVVRTVPNKPSASIAPSAASAPAARSTNETQSTRK